MPELPEVETMVRSLRPVLEGRMIIKVRVSDPLILQDVTPRRFTAALRHRTVSRLRRRGKWIVMELDSLQAVLVQLRMTGGFRAGCREQPRYARLHLRLDGPHPDLWYCDLRRLGRFELLDQKRLAEKLSARFHGPEATEVKYRQLRDALRSTRRAIKAALLDQRLVSGIGNIYADECLFDSRIHPETAASDLDDDAIRRLAGSIRKIVRLAIRLQGTTFRNYFNVFGESGSFQDRHRVYGRGGKPCHLCGTIITRANIEGLKSRSSHYCGNCQR